VAPTDPSGTVLEDCLRVRQSGAIRVLVALVRMILDLWAAPPPRCGYWGSLGFFCFAPQDFGMLGVFCARFPPREASISNYSANDNDKIKSKSSSVSLLQRFAMSRHLHRISKVRTFRKAQETYFKINLDGMCRIDHLTNKIYR
jgi:hypothetical protein